MIGRIIRAVRKKPRPMLVGRQRLGFFERRRCTIPLWANRRVRGPAVKYAPRMPKNSLLRRLRKGCEMKRIAILNFCGPSHGVRRNAAAIQIEIYLASGLGEKLCRAACSLGNSGKT